MTSRTDSLARRVVCVATVIVMAFVAAPAAGGAGISGTTYLGSAAGVSLNRPIVGMAATPTGRGYWLVASDGGIFTFGDARYYGSTGNRHLNRPIVGMAATHSGHGYWLVASDGGIFTFGDARFHGSTGNRHLNQPIVGMAATPTGRGYWLVAADGGVFTFGNAGFHGSAAGALPAPTVGIAATPSGRGYWIAGADGMTRAFGDARQFGTQIAATASSVVTIAASPKNGYWVAERDGTVGTAISGSPGTRTSPTAAIAAELFSRMNTERAARHESALAWDPMLAGYASSWAGVLLPTGQLDHQDLGAILVAANGRFVEVGENLFLGAGPGAVDAGSAHLTLMESAEHRANMLLAQGKLVGIGAACGGGKLVVVEDFAITAGSPLPPAGQAVPAEYPIVSTNPGGAHC